MIRTALFEYQIFQLGTNRANLFSIYRRIARQEALSNCFWVSGMASDEFQQNSDKNIDQQATVNGWLINL